MQYLVKAGWLLLFVLLLTLIMLMPRRIERLFNSLQSTDTLNDLPHYV